MPLVSESRSTNEINLPLGVSTGQVPVVEAEVGVGVVPVELVKRFADPLIWRTDYVIFLNRLSQ